MFGGILKAMGVHVHDWAPFGEVVETPYRSETPIVDTVFDGYDEYGEEVFIEFPTGRFHVDEWSESHQSRTCTSCGKVEQRRVY
jgi:hypothetical protein